MSSFYPKVRQEGFDIPQSQAQSQSQSQAHSQPHLDNPPSPSADSFDPSNMFFGHHMFPSTAQDPIQHFKSTPDFADEIAAMMDTTHQNHNHNHQPQQQPPQQPQPQPQPQSHPPPHNPFDTSIPYRTIASPGSASHPHNIFDVSSTGPFPTHFSLPTHAHHTFDTTRSRSRSKMGRDPNGGRVPRSKRGPSPISPRPAPILIPPTSNGHAAGHHPVSPLNFAQTAPSAWFIDSPFRGGESFRTADSPFSLPTPDSIPVHAPFGNAGTSPKSVSAKESPPPGDAASKQAQLASEKRRRRRESHNAVERRRRDNINEKISELATLIPECMLDPNGGGEDTFPGDVEERKETAANGGAVKANKGMILRKSVDYIRYLQQLVTAQADRNRELESQLQLSNTSDPASSTSPPEGQDVDADQEFTLDKDGFSLDHSQSHGGKAMGGDLFFLGGLANGSDDAGGAMSASPSSHRRKGSDFGMVGVEVDGGGDGERGRKREREIVRVKRESEASVEGSGGPESKERGDGEDEEGDGMEE
ncbi:helix-loop-helix DNA-binding domain-containing protein [Hysterangium stoloniferum]|nr:helix-loop-helix DNA-binding domain-containing protein [Hysterangium stoloniferum]